MHVFESAAPTPVLSQLAVLMYHQPDEAGLAAGAWVFEILPDVALPAQIATDIEARVRFAVATWAPGAHEDWRREMGAACTFNWGDAVVWLQATDWRIAGLRLIGQVTDPEARLVVHDDDALGV